METVTRFAPSPNGPLHLGHAWSAIVAHDLARERGGRFLVRIEDIDGARSRPEFVDGALADLRWLGLEWDGPSIRQSERAAAHCEALERLKREGLVYPCRCTRAEIAAMARETGPDGPIYPGTCRDAALAPEGQVAWRLDMSKALAAAGPLTWEDELAGLQIARPELFGDVVLDRKDAPGSYHLAVTLDDAADRVSLVTRGLDLFAATHVHRLLQALLGLPVPRWHHHDLLVDERGEKLAKRRCSPALADRRLRGEDGRALAAAMRGGHFPDGLALSQAGLANRGQSA